MGQQRTAARCVSSEGLPYAGQMKCCTSDIKEAEPRVSAAFLVEEECPQVGTVQGRDSSPRKVSAKLEDEEDKARLPALVRHVSEALAALSCSQFGSKLHLVSLWFLRGHSGEQQQKGGLLLEFLLIGSEKLPQAGSTVMGKCHESSTSGLHYQSSCIVSFSTFYVLHSFHFS